MTNHTWIILEAIILGHTCSYLYCIRLSFLNQDRGFFQVPKSFNFQVAAPDWNDVSESCGLLDGARTSFRWHVAAEKIDYRHLSTPIDTVDCFDWHRTKKTQKPFRCRNGEQRHIIVIICVFGSTSLAEICGSMAHSFAFLEYQETRLARDHLDFTRTSCESISVLKLSLIGNHRILGVMEWIWQNILLLKDSESIGYFMENRGKVVTPRKQSMISALTVTFGFVWK